MANTSILRRCVLVVLALTLSFSLVESVETRGFDLLQEAEVQNRKNDRDINNRASRSLFGASPITRSGPVTIEDGIEYGSEPGGSNPTFEKFIQMNYAVQTDVNHTVNVTTFEDDCKTRVESVLPTNYNVFPASTNVSVAYNPLVVENISLSDIWKPDFNDAMIETGGNFSFCVRVELIHVPTGYGINFHETIFSAKVDKLAIGFSLTVDVDREEAGDEETSVDYSASLNAFSCDVASFTLSNDTVSQGDALGLCVTSLTDGINVVGWQSLTISKENDNSFEFVAINDGVGVDGLVVESCDSASNQCTSEVQLLSNFFDADGILAVTGTMILSVNGRRHLKEIDAQINPHSSSHDSLRILEQDAPTIGMFGVSVELKSESSSAARVSASCLSIAFLTSIIMNFMM